MEKDEELDHLKKLQEDIGKLEREFFQEEGSGSEMEKGGARKRMRTERCLYSHLGT